MKSSLKKRLLVAAIAIAALIIVPVTVISPCVVRSLHVPQMQRLAPITAAEMHFTETLPPGNYFNFLITVPKGQTLVSPVRGLIFIKEAGHDVIECPIGAETIERFGSIGNDDSPGYYLRWPENIKQPVKGILRGRHTYDFVIRFSQMPPEGSSLWMNRLQRGSD
ncbi:MAG: hypothetical protein ABI162_14735 [Luteolibacter sp.]